VKVSTRRTPQLMAKLSMLVVTEKPMDGETLSIFNFVNACYYSLLLLLSFFKACNVPRVLASQ
jgi:hypothetical protein